jgi:hypothetical protein
MDPYDDNCVFASLLMPRVESGWVTSIRDSLLLSVGGSTRRRGTLRVRIYT